MFNISKRSLNLFCALLCLFLFGVSLYLQYSAHIEPCLLCLLQRTIVISLGILFVLISFFKSTQSIMRGVFSTLIILMSSLGLLLAGRHIWLQTHSALYSKQATAACLPGLSYMIQNFSLMEIIHNILSHTHQCAEVQWTLLGVNLSIGLLLFFGFFLLVGLFNLFYHKRIDSTI